VPPPDAQSPEELAAVQRRRERIERDLAAGAQDEREAREHGRRAAKAGYLEEKLADQAESDRQAGG
jgi:hypothetical protein